MKGIPQKRLIIYLLIAGLLPVLFAFVNHLSKTSYLNELEQTFERVGMQALAFKQKDFLNASARQTYADSDHFYIDKHLESLVLRENEIENLTRLIAQANMPDNDLAIKRLEFLTGKSNKLFFSEGIVYATPKYQEVFETLVHPVEVDIEDIQKILAGIEGVPMGGFLPGADRPQLMITEFKLDKKSDASQNEVFLLNVKVLRREYL